MPKWTENENRCIPDFDRAMELRDAGKLTEARAVLAEVIAQLHADDRRLLVHAHLQSGHMATQQGDTAARELHCRRAAEVAPTFDLASLAYFLALFEVHRIDDALREALRYLSIRDSNGYRELFDDSYGDGFTPEQRAMVARARELLAEHTRN